MKVYWTEWEGEQCLLLKEETIKSADGFLKTERIILGGVNMVGNGYHIGWAINTLGYTVHILSRFLIEKAKIDVEEYLLFRGILSEPLTYVENEKAA